MAEEEERETSVVEEQKKEPILQFAPLHSSVDEGFWHKLYSLKLNELGLEESAIPITGFYAPCSSSQVSNYLTLTVDSLPHTPEKLSESSTAVQGNRNRCPVPGIIYNTNTIEGFQSLDRRSLLNAEAKKIWEDIRSGIAAEDCARLSRFLVISYADLKNWVFHYWFAFPTLVLDPPATSINLVPALQWLNQEEAESLRVACNRWRSDHETAHVPFFMVSIDSNSIATVSHLKDRDARNAEGLKTLFGFYDPCHLPQNPGWPLRNLLALVSSRWDVHKVTFFCYRESRGFADLKLSMVGETFIPDTSGMEAVVGWELNRGKLIPRFIDLSHFMDPERLALSAADLNLKLMRWKALPSLDLDVLSSTRCLILGAGTLGCQVSRMLLAWGMREITMVDCGRVSASNPLRQSLYTLDDVGEAKASASVRSLRRIFPHGEIRGVEMAIPMPGHADTCGDVRGSSETLRELVCSHDAVFLLTDTRESRWLPSLLCAASANKVAITAALGFDSFLVMRHGPGPLPPVTSSFAASRGMPLPPRLGCYFCSDVVAPANSTADRTLDQQCTVTRPALAPIAAALAVELLIGILHHPLRAHADADDACGTGGALGILPHQVRGSLSQFSQMILTGRASESCTACSDTVVSEYWRRGWGFVEEVVNRPTCLEDVTGLTDLMRSAASFRIDWEAEE